MSAVLNTDASVQTNPYAVGAAYVDGKYMPIADARIPVTDWGYRRSDVTYDVVSLYHGNFFRLDDHIRRFMASMAALRMKPAEDEAGIRAVLTQCVRLTGLREAYVAMDCLRGRPLPGQPYHPAFARNYITAFAIPFVWLLPDTVRERGAHIITGSRPRISERSVDPRVKNFHWADMNHGLFEALEAGADTCVLLDDDGNVTEGPGFNIFALRNGAVTTPDRGVLEGITRMSTIELCADAGLPCTARPMKLEELHEADEVFISSTAGGIMPVSRIDNRILGNDRPGPVGTKLRELYWAKRAAGWHATPIDYAAAA